MKPSACLGAEVLMKLLGNYCRNIDVKTFITVGVVGEYTKHVWPATLTVVALIFMTWKAGFLKIYLLLYNISVEGV